jgi:tetratricopeptide (TPR) repeat protein
MFVARGAFPSARKNLQKALRAAERRGLREPQGMAAHDLFTVEAECNNVTEAQEYAARALRAYGAGHPDLPALAYDVAFLWVLQGRFSDALPVFRAAVPRMRAWHQPYGHAGLARAAGAMGDESIFDSARVAVWNLSDEIAGKADALVGTACGAISLGRWTQAEEAGEAALSLARARGQTKVMFEAEAVLESVRMERRASLPQVQTESASTGSNYVPDEVVTLAQQFVHCLEAGAAI